MQLFNQFSNLQWILLKFSDRYINTTEDLCIYSAKRINFDLMHEFSFHTLTRVDWKVRGLIMKINTDFFENVFTFQHKHYLTRCIYSNAVIPVLKNDYFMLSKYSWTATWTSSFDENLIPSKRFFRFGKRWKSDRAK